MPTTAEPPDFAHAAAFYDGDRQYLDTVVPFVMEGLNHGDPVLVAVPGDKLTLLREALGDAADRTEMSDMTEVGRNPASTFMMFAAALGNVHTGRRVRAVAEPVWHGRSAEEYPACVQNEALFNIAFGDRNLHTLCPYDAGRLPAGFISDAKRTHPLIHLGGRDVPCPDYDWQQAWTDFNEPLTTDPCAATYLVAGLADLAVARSFAAEYATSVGLPAEGVGDLNLIVTELATNSLKYTSGGCQLALWQHLGKLVCEVRDRGRLDDKLAGRQPAPAGATGGRGLLLVNAIADLVRTHTSDTGTTFQVYLPLPVAGELAM